MLVLPPCFGTSLHQYDAGHENGMLFQRHGQLPSCMLSWPVTVVASQLYCQNLGPLSPKLSMATAHAFT